MYIIAMHNHYMHLLFWRFLASLFLAVVCNYICSQWVLSSSWCY